MFGAIIDASVNTVATTFNSGAGSLILDSASAGKNIGFINLTSRVIAFSFSSASEVPESAITVNRNQGFVPAQGATTMDGVLMSNRAKIYIRSADGSAIGSGTIYAWVWGL